ncbi:Rap1a/Tai family immunity protein [Methyloterricola oryzae]|uniref:Rap1a/Tai family immunity protein n=1 Tax=Methyloterricola oryzae TaxID=1495050 RepID=UPI0005EBDDF6|nr:Rap1a/Tai family immunity protein [Methyloterricola oryzae]
MKSSKRRWLCLSAAAAILAAGDSGAVTQDNFLAQTTQDMVELCTAAPDDPLYVAATHFCQGYLVGVYRYQEDLYSRPGLTPLVCPPDPKPTRTEAIAMYITWAKAHPEYKNERPVDTAMKYLVENWPCKK